MYVIILLYFRDFGLTHVSSGDLLRAHMRDGTALGKEAKAFIDKGKMVKELPICIDIVKSRADATL